MLISRSEAKLKAVQAEIAEQYPSVKVDYAVALTLTLTVTPNPNRKPKPKPKLNPKLNPNPHTVH